MEFVSEGLSPRQESALPHVAVLAPILTEMNGAVYDAGVGTDQFHDVDLAAGRPSDGRVVGAQHPDGWPDALPLGKDGPDVDAAVLELLQVDGLHPCGSVLEPILPGHDEEVAIVYIRVLAVAGVVLEFLVAPATGAEVVGPIGEVDGSPFKFIGPYHGHAGIALGGHVSLVRHEEQGIVVPDGADGFLRASGHQGVRRAGDDKAELLVLLEEFIDDDLHWNRGRGCARRDDDRVLDVDVVQTCLCCQGAGLVSDDDVA